jgi:hypothetical protein
VSVELDKFPIITIRNHAGEVTIYDFTPTREDKLIRAFRRGENVPPEFGTVDPTGQILTIGGDSRDKPKIKPRVPIKAPASPNINDVVYDQVLIEFAQLQPAKGASSEPAAFPTNPATVSLAGGTSR